MCPVRSVTYLSGRSLLNKIGHPDLRAAFSVCARQDKAVACPRNQLFLWGRSHRAALFVCGKAQDSGEIAVQIGIEPALAVGELSSSFNDAAGSGEGSAGDGDDAAGYVPEHDDDADDDHHDDHDDDDDDDGPRHCRKRGKGFGYRRGDD